MRALDDGPERQLRLTRDAAAALSLGAEVHPASAACIRLNVGVPHRLLRGWAGNDRTVYEF